MSPLIQQLLTRNACSGSKNESIFDLFEFTDHTSFSSMLIHALFSFFSLVFMCRILLLCFIVLLQVGSGHAEFEKPCAKELQPSSWLQQGPAAHDSPGETWSDLADKGFLKRILRDFAGFHGRFSMVFIA